jgi:hypothetical protein
VPELFLDRIQDLVSVIDSNLAKIFLHTFGKANLKHAHMVAYALPNRNGPKDPRSSAAESRPGLPWEISTGINKDEGGGMKDGKDRGDRAPLPLQARRAITSLQSCTSFLSYETRLGSFS